MKRYISKHKILFMIVILFMLIASIMNVGMAMVFKVVIDAIMEKNMELFIKVSLFFLAWEIVRYYFQYCRSRLTAKFLCEVACDLRNDIFSSLLKRDIGEFKKDNSGKYISNLTNDVSTLYVGYFDNIFMIIEGILSLVLGALTIAYINVYILIGILLFAIINLLVSMEFGQKINILAKNYSNIFEMFTGKIKDMFEGFEVIRSFNIENKINETFKDQNYKVEHLKLKSRKKELTLGFVLDLIGTFTFLVALAIGGYFTIVGTITVGAMMAATQLMNNIVNPILTMGRRLGKLTSVKSVAQKLDSIIMNENSEMRSENTIVKTKFNDNISFNKVSFQYNEDKKVLNNISFKFEKGKKYAIIGRSGCGKSTILKLLLKYYKEFSGDIRIDNASIEDINSSSLYNLISIIHQNVFMFDGSIRDNITLFNDYSNEELSKAIKDSGLYDMIISLPEKENSLVGENGCNLSGGEKQRLSIARALIKKTPILVLDEATSSLDNKTSYEIQKSILEVPDLTCMTITHSFSEELLRKYDEILIIDDGMVAEKGTFGELIDSKGYFYSLFTINNSRMVEEKKKKVSKVV